MTRICGVTSATARGLSVLAIFAAIVLCAGLAQAAPPGARPHRRGHGVDDEEEATSRAVHTQHWAPALEDAEELNTNATGIYKGSWMLLSRAGAVPLAGSLGAVVLQLRSAPTPDAAVFSLHGEALMRAPLMRGSSGAAGGPGGAALAPSGQVGLRLQLRGVWAPGSGRLHASADAQVVVRVPYAAATANSGGAPRFDRGGAAAAAAEPTNPSRHRDGSLPGSVDGPLPPAAAAALKADARRWQALRLPTLLLHQLMGGSDASAPGGGRASRAAGSEARPQHRSVQHNAPQQQWRQTKPRAGSDGAPAPVAAWVAGADAALLLPRDCHFRLEGLLLPRPPPPAAAAGVDGALLLPSRPGSGAAAAAAAAAEAAAEAAAATAASSEMRPQGPRTEPTPPLAEAIVVGDSAASSAPSSGGSWMPTTLPVVGSSGGGNVDSPGSSSSSNSGHFRGLQGSALEEEAQWQQQQQQQWLQLRRMLLQVGDEDGGDAEEAEESSGAAGGPPVQPAYESNWATAVPSGGGGVDVGVGVGVGGGAAPSSSSSSHTPSAAEPPLLQLQALLVSEACNVSWELVASALAPPPPRPAASVYAHAGRDGLHAATTVVVGGGVNVGSDDDDDDGDEDVDDGYHHHHHHHHTRQRPSSLPAMLLPGAAAYEHALGYAAAAVAAALAQIVLTRRQVAALASPAAAARASLLTLGHHAALDAYLCAMHLVAGLVLPPPLSHVLAAAAALQFVVFAVYELRAVLGVWACQAALARRVRGVAAAAAGARRGGGVGGGVAAAAAGSSSNGGSWISRRGGGGSSSSTQGNNSGVGVALLQPADGAATTASDASAAAVWFARFVGAGDAAGDAARRELWLLYARTYGLLVAGLLLAYQLHQHAALLLLLVHSFWLPQVLHSAAVDARQPLAPSYVCGVSAARLLLPTYLLTCPDSLLRLPPQPGLAAALAAWVLLQAAALLAQSRWGPRCFVPASLLSGRRYDYHRPAVPRGVCVATVMAAKDKLGEPLSSDCADVDVAVVADDDVEAALPPGCGTECAICLSRVPYEPLGARMVTPCGHFYHPPCLSKWLDVALACPTCRSPLPPV